MKIAILSRNSNLYSTRRLVEAAKLHGHEARVIDHMKCFVGIEAGNPTLYYKGEQLKNIDAIIPRIGASVTLRRTKMYDFLERFINVALPRVRDFKGLSGNSFDGRGNYSCGVKEQIIFPEVNYEKIEKVRGLSVTICTTAETDEESKALLTAFGMPFRK